MEKVQNSKGFETSKRNMKANFYAQIGKQLMRITSKEIPDGLSTYKLPADMTAYKFLVRKDGKTLTPSEAQFLNEQIVFTRVVGSEILTGEVSFVFDSNKWVKENNI